MLTTCNDAVTQRNCCTFNDPSLAAVAQRALRVSDARRADLRALVGSVLSRDCLSEGVAECGFVNQLTDLRLNARRIETALGE